MPVEYDPVDKTLCWSAYGHWLSCWHCTAIEPEPTLALYCYELDKHYANMPASRMWPECDLMVTWMRYKCELNANRQRQRWYVCCYNTYRPTDEAIITLPLILMTVFITLGGAFIGGITTKSEGRLSWKGGWCYGTVIGLCQGPVTDLS